MPTAFGNRLALAMQHAGFDPERSQSDIARRLKIKQSTVHYLLHRGQGSKHVSSIADLLGVNATWLATGRGGMISPAGQQPDTDPAIQSQKSDQQQTGDYDEIPRPARDPKNGGSMRDLDPLLQIWPSLSVRQKNILLEMVEEFERSLSADAPQRPSKRRV